MPVHLFILLPCYSMFNTVHQAVHDNAENVKEERDELRLGPKYEEYKKLYSQHAAPTLYTLFNELRANALIYDDNVRRKSNRVHKMVADGLKKEFG